MYTKFAEAMLIDPDADPVARAAMEPASAGGAAAEAQDEEGDEATAARRERQRDQLRAERRLLRSQFLLMPGALCCRPARPTTRREPSLTRLSRAPLPPAARPTC